MNCAKDPRKTPSPSAGDHRPHLGKCIEIHYWLVVDLPLWKNMSSSVGMIPNYYGKNTSHVPVTTSRTINRWFFFCRWASIKMGDLLGIGGCLSCFHGVSSFTAYGTSSHLESSQVIVSFPLKRPEGWSPVIGGSQNVLPPALDLQYSSWSSWFTTVKSMWNPYCPTVDALKKLGSWLNTSDIPKTSHEIALFVAKKNLTKSPIISYQIPCFSPFFTSTNDWLVVQ